MKDVFAIVCEWPEAIAAENETIIRIRKAASEINKKTIIINRYGAILDVNMKSSSKFLANDDVDFVISLHFSSAKCYDGFSYVALWNPVKFYHDWGYRQYSANLITHHDFISCLSQTVDDHAVRISHINNSRHLSPKAILSHTNCGPYYDSGKERSHIFYCGINWDRSSGKSRFSEIFEALDNKGILKIYGPKRLSRKNIPWKGFKSYVEDIPFDGVSMFDKVSECLLGLALSHEAHIESGIASSRVFELISGGALPICDENPFFRKNFGDKVLYVSGSQVEKAKQIEVHYKWAIENKDEVRQMVDVLQDIKKEKFSLSKQLLSVYEGHEKRRSLLESKYCALQDKMVVNAIYIHDVNVKDYEDDFCNLRDSIGGQMYRNIKVIIASNCQNLNSIKALDDLNIRYIIIKHSYGYDRLGAILEIVQEKFPDSQESQLFMVINRYEKLFYDHVSSLVRKYEENVNLMIAESSSVVADRDQHGPFINYGYSGQEGKFPGYDKYAPGGIMFKEFPPKFILRYLDYHNYNKFFRSFYREGSYKKTSRTTFQFLVSKNIYKDAVKNSLHRSLVADYGLYHAIEKEGMSKMSKDTAHEMLSHIKIFSPIIKVRNFLQRRKLRRRNIVDL